MFNFVIEDFDGLASRVSFRLAFVLLLSPRGVEAREEGGKLTARLAAASELGQGSSAGKETVELLFELGRRDDVELLKQAVSSKLIGPREVRAERVGPRLRRRDLAIKTERGAVMAFPVLSRCPSRFCQKHLKLPFVLVVRTFALRRITIIRLEE